MKKTAKGGKEPAINAMKVPGKALDLGAKIGSAASSEKTEAALSTMPDVITFYHTGKCLFLGKFVEIFRL